MTSLDIVLQKAIMTRQNSLERFVQVSWTTLQMKL